MCQLLRKSLKIIKEQKSSEWEVDSNNDMHVKCSQVYHAHPMHSDKGYSSEGLLNTLLNYHHSEENRCRYKLIVDFFWQACLSNVLKCKLSGNI